LQSSIFNFQFQLRPYQLSAFQNHTNGIEVWLWGRQTGKSFTLAAWALDRLIRHPGRLVTILSNSRANGMELNLKCAEIWRLWGAHADRGNGQSLLLFSSPRMSQSAPSPIVSSSLFSRNSKPELGKSTVILDQHDFSSDYRFETMNYETRLTINGRVGRIKVLPANPRTARGFSGDLILDEFAFHEDSFAIWEAVEPILSAHPDYLCRVASTPNGRYNMFYRLATDPRSPLRKITRSEAWRQGLRIYHPITRTEITPEQARDLALDKRAYDQNYECVFENENMALLTAELITAAERESIGFICDQDWSPEALSFLRGAHAPRVSQSPIDSSSSASGVSPVSLDQLSITNHQFFVGLDVGRSHDLTVITVLEKQPHSQRLIVRAILRLRNLRLPDQQQRLAAICRLPQFRAAHIDMTGLGLGLYEYAQQQFGPRIHGINFASSIPCAPFQVRNQKSEIKNAPVPQVLATQLLQAYEDRRIHHPIDQQLRDDLRKPERITSPTGRVSIAATRDGAGHADHFWSLALAVNAALSRPESYLHVITRQPGLRRLSTALTRASRRQRIPRRHLI
jgi:phage FluMu gp28-like protein